MNEGRIKTGPVELAYETLGDPADPPLLLVMGLGMQLIHWDLELCEELAGSGFHVIRFDNRDAGLSTKIDAPVPPIVRAMAGFHIDAPYLLRDMAGDTFGLLDGLGIERAHVMGVSMGGMIAQAMAMERPERVLSLASIPMPLAGSTRFTTMTTSAHVSRAMSTGMLRTIPPSARMYLSRVTGANAPGIAMLARMAVARSPLFRTTMSPVTMSVATARYGIGSRSKSGSMRARAT